MDGCAVGILKNKLLTLNSLLVSNVKTSEGMLKAEEESVELLEKALEALLVARSKMKDAKRSQFSRNASRLRSASKMSRSDYFTATEDIMRERKLNHAGSNLEPLLRVDDSKKKEQRRFSGAIGLSDTKAKRLRNERKLTDQSSEMTSAFDKDKPDRVNPVKKKFFMQTPVIYSRKENQDMEGEGDIIEVENWKKESGIQIKYDQLSNMLELKQNAPFSPGFEQEYSTNRGVSKNKNTERLGENQTDIKSTENDQLGRSLFKNIKIKTENNFSSPILSAVQQKAESNSSRKLITNDKTNNKIVVLEDHQLFHLETSLTTRRKINEIYSQLDSQDNDLSKRFSKKNHQSFTKNDSEYRINTGTSEQETPPQIDTKSHTKGEPEKNLPEDRKLNPVCASLRSKVNLLKRITTKYQNYSDILSKKIDKKYTNISGGEGPSKSSSSMNAGVPLNSFHGGSTKNGSPVDLINTFVRKSPLNKTATELEREYVNDVKPFFGKLNQQRDLLHPTHTSSKSPVQKLSALRLSPRAKK